MNRDINLTTSAIVLAIVGLLSWWMFAPAAVPTPAPVVVIEESQEEEAGAPGSVFQAGALVREGRQLVDRANTTLDRFEREGVIVKPAQSPAICSPLPGYSACRPRGIFRRRR